MAKSKSRPAGSGGNATTGSLDRVRVDSTDQPLTTNQGVPVGDNQSSLKAGLRGPTLLEDFAARLKAEGAVVKCLGARLGAVKSATGKSIVADATFANMPSVLFDGVVLPDGDAAVAQLLADGRALEFVKDQHRHCKTMLVLGSGAQMLEKLEISAVLPSPRWQSTGISIAN